MTLTYDPRYNIAYLRLKDRTEEVETIGVSESLAVDLSPDGTVYGIELLNADEQLLGDDGASLEIINDALAERQVVRFA